MLMRAQIINLMTKQVLCISQQFYFVVQHSKHALVQKTLITTSTEESENARKNQCR